MRHFIDQLKAHAYLLQRGARSGEGTVKRLPPQANDYAASRIGLLLCSNGLSALVPKF